MTRAEKNSTLVGKGSKEKLTQQFGSRMLKDNRLPVALRDQIATYQDWVMALILLVFSEKYLKFTVRFVEAEEFYSQRLVRLEVQAAAD